VISLAGTFTQFSQTLKEKRLPIVFFRRPEEGQEELVKEQAAWLSLWLSALLSMTGLLYAAVQNLGGPQGRYLFPSEIAFMALILFGLAGLGRKWGKWLVFAFVGGNALTLLFSIVMLFSMFGVKLKPY
jgi:hypothetical protein